MYSVFVKATDKVRQGGPSPILGPKTQILRLSISKKKRCPTRKIFHPGKQLFSRGRGRGCPKMDYIYYAVGWCPLFSRAQQPPRSISPGSGTNRSEEALLLLRQQGDPSGLCGRVAGIAQADDSWMSCEPLGRGRLMQPLAWCSWLMLVEHVEVINVEASNESGR